MNKRDFLRGTVSVAALAAAAGFGGSALLTESIAEGTFEVTKTEAEWRAALSPEAFAVLRQEATERPWTSPLLKEHREGTFDCGGCGLALYRSQDKYDSRTGWPSFTQAIDKAVGERSDNSYFMVRTELHCARCGGHLGHVFDDGPPPTGKRHCINGLSLSFTPA